MLIRKNTKAFKAILEILTACRDRPDREQLVRLYITKAGDTVRDRISIEGIEGGAGLFYEMNYQSVLGNLLSSNHQLIQSDEIPGIYFFHSSSNKVWDETPFEFDEAIRKEFDSLPELPVMRKKEKAAKVAFPTPGVKAAAPPAGKKKSLANKEKLRAKKDEGEAKKAARVVDLWPKQPDYGLRHEIHFTGLERLVFRQPPMARKDVLDYYNNIADYLLPHLKDRPQRIRLYRDGHQGPASTTLESLRQNSPEEIPDWVRTAPVGKGKKQEHLLLCNDREHLLFYVQIGCLEFHTGLSRIKSLQSPDYLILTIGSSDDDLSKTIEGALALKVILDGLQLPSFVKTDGISGLHIYIPLNAKSNYRCSRDVAEYLSRLVRIKIPGLVTVEGIDAHTYGKVSLDYSLNVQGRGVIAPYSLVVPSAQVATPLSWEEVNEGLTMDAFNFETIFKRVKDDGDTFGNVSGKKVDASELLGRLHQHYAFLF